MVRAALANAGAVRIDHILFGPAFRALRCEVDKTASESDHYPIQAVLSLSPASDK